MAMAMTVQMIMKLMMVMTNKVMVMTMQMLMKMMKAMTKGNGNDNAELP